MLRGSARASAVGVPPLSEEGGNCSRASSGSWHVRGSRMENPLPPPAARRPGLAADPAQQRYSVALGERVIGEIRLELFCDDDVADQLATLIAQAAKPGPGWVFVSEIQNATQIV